MIQNGVFSGYFPYTLAESADVIRGHGFNCVQLDLHFKDLDVGPGELTREKCLKVRETFRDRNLPIVAISCYSNIVHPFPEKRKAVIERFKEVLRHARDLGSPYVCSETGTFNEESDWIYHPKNSTEQAWDECRAVISELAQYAYDHGAVYALETYVNNVVRSVPDTLRMFAEVDHPGLALVMDPTNYFDQSNIGRMDETLNEIFDALDDKICIAHAKDVLTSESEDEKHADIGDAEAADSHTFRGVARMALPAPGLGWLNYELFLKRLAKHHPNIPLLIEHFEEPDIARAKAYLDGKLRETGL